MNCFLGGYRRLIRRGLFMVAFVTAAVAIATAVVAPLWLLATQSTGLYNALVVCAVLAAGTATAVHRVRIRARVVGSRQALRVLVLVPLGQLAIMLAGLALLLGGAAAWANGYPLLATVAVLLSLAMVGVRSLVFSRLASRESA